MKKLAAYLIFVLSVLIYGSIAVQAATKTPVKKKPAATNKATMGTTQLRGDQAQIGTTYTLGKANPINFTLTKVEYRTDQVFISDDTICPTGEEKLLILHYTVHNPQKRDFTYGWNTLKFIAVDANTMNRDFCGGVGKEGKGERLYMSLKPAQKTQAFTVIKVPAKGEIPKLIVESRDHLVLRYDLKGKVKGLSAPIIDPSDSTGATALAEVPAQKGEYYPVGLFDLKLDKAELKDGPLGSYRAKRGYRFLAATYTIKSKFHRKNGISWSTFKPELKDADNATCEWVGDLVRASRDEKLNAMTLEPGEEISLRHLFQVPADIPLKSLAIREGRSEGRRYVYDLSDLK